MDAKTRLIQKAKYDNCLKIRDKYGVNILFNHNDQQKEVVLLKGWELPTEITMENIVGYARLTRSARRKVIKGMRNYGN